MRRFPFAALLGALVLSGCMTVHENAPVELHAAKTSLNAAYDKDVDRYLPLTMGQAKAAFDEGVEYYRDSEDYRALNQPGRSAAARDHAIARARVAKKLADDAMDLYTNIRNWDHNIDRYTAMKSEPADEFLIIKPVAFFLTDSADLSRTVSEDVERLVFLLRRHPELMVELRGYADYRGGELYNKKLGMRRAEAVARVLRKNGIANDRIKLLAVGEELTLSDKGDFARLQLDRRVEAKLTVLSH